MLLKLKEGGPCDKVVKDLAELCFVGQRAVLASNEPGYLAKEISKQNGEGVVWCLLALRGEK